MERASEGQLVTVLCSWCRGNGWVEAFVFSAGFEIIKAPCPNCEGIGYQGAVYGEVAV